jgi:hypothetical protein
VPKLQKIIAHPRTLSSAAAWYPPTKVSPQPSLPALQSEARLLGLLRLQGPVAQSGERRPRMAEVRGSNPLGSTLFFYLFAGKMKKASAETNMSQSYCAATRTTSLSCFCNPPRC